MKLSNTMIVNGAVMPSKKAFTLAEVLITLSILGVVAALTIPSLVNRQSEMAAIVKLKKAVSQFEQVTEVYMAEEEAQNMVNMVKSSSSDTECNGLAKYFKIVKENDGKCDFTTADGVRWVFKSDGTAAVAFDSSATTPKVGVALSATDGAANKETVAAATVTGLTTTKPEQGIFQANDMLKINKPADYSASGHPSPITSTKKS